jgi:hypothetical protein
MTSQKKQITTISLLPEVKVKASKRAENLKRSLSAHVEFLIEKDLKESEVK